jgi:hypothetical protein
MPGACVPIGHTPCSTFERIDPYVEAAEFSFEDIWLRRLNEFRKVIAFDVGCKRSLILVAFIKQPLLRIVVILGDVELPTTGLSLETSVRVLLGERTKIACAAQCDFEFGNDRNHRSTPLTLRFGLLGNVTRPVLVGAGEIGAVTHALARVRECVVDHGTHRGHDTKLAGKVGGDLHVLRQ